MSLMSILLAETASDRNLVLLITLLVTTTILVVAILIVRLFAYLHDSDDAEIWVMAIRPTEFDKSWESPFDYAQMAERICGVSYFDLIWPRDKSKTPEEHQLMYDNGVSVLGSSRIENMIESATAHWQRRNIFKMIPSVGRRLEIQLASFTKVANFARSKELVLFLVSVDASEVPKEFKDRIAT